MTPFPSRLRCGALAGLAVLLLVGCVGAGGYGGDGYGTGYYGVYGANFTDWGPGYAVGPFRGNRFYRGGGGSGFAHHWRGTPGRGGIPFLPPGHGGLRGGRGR